MSICSIRRNTTQSALPGAFAGSGAGDAVPRAGNASGGGQPGAILKCKGWEADPNAYIYFITQAAVWPAICKVIGEPQWIEDENGDPFVLDLLSLRDRLETRVPGAFR